MTKFEVIISEEVVSDRMCSDCRGWWRGCMMVEKMEDGGEDGGWWRRWRMVGRMEDGGEDGGWWRGWRMVQRVIEVSLYV